MEEIDRLAGGEPFDQTQLDHLPVGVRQQLPSWMAQSVIFGLSAGLGRTFRR